MPLSADQVSDQLSLRNPALYVRGQWNLDLNLRTFAMWIVNAFVHAFIVFFLPITLRDEGWGDDGQTDGLYVIGTTIYTCLLLTMVYKVALCAQ